MSSRFRSVDYYPPGGLYWYQDKHGRVEGRYKTDMITGVRNLFRRSGRDIPHDPWGLVMECMCPFLPDGACNEPSGVKVVRMQEVRDNTRTLFHKPNTSYDIIESRLLKCQSCPKHSRTFCPGCVGFSVWIKKGFDGRREAIPIDQVCGVCTVDCVLASAVATLEDPPKLGEEAPNGCWRC